MNVWLAILPSLDSFMTSATDLFMACARISQAGTPASVSCRISSPETFVLARICPRARISRLIPSVPRPRALAALPTSVIRGMTSLAENPMASRRREAVSIPGKSKGVSRAKVFRSASIPWAACAEPSIVVQAIWLCSMLALKPTTASCTPPNRVRAMAIPPRAAAKPAACCCTRLSPVSAPRVSAPTFTISWAAVIAIPLAPSLPILGRLGLSIQRRQCAVAPFNAHLI